jgi:hypothetical protein
MELKRKIAQEALAGDIPFDFMVFPETYFVQPLDYSYNLKDMLYPKLPGLKMLRETS